MLGGTGPMGIHLSKILSKRGDNVYITSRKKHENFGRIFYIQGNARDVDFANKILNERKWDCIIDFMVYGTDEFKQRLDCLMQSTKQYVFLSSSRVYADSNGLLTEESPRLLDVTHDDIYLKTDEYALYKAREEDVILQSNYSNYTILRPYITFAENRLPLGVWEKETWVRRILEKKDLVLPSLFLTKETTLTYGLDVSVYISKVIGNPSAIGQVFNIVSDKCCKWSEILEFYLDQAQIITGYRPKVFVVNSFITGWRMMLNNWLKDICHLGFKKYDITISNRNYQLIYDREFNRKFNNNKLKNLIPDYTFSNYSEHLGKCLKSFSSDPQYSYNKVWEWEALQDRLTKRKTSIFCIPTLKSKIKYVLIRYIIPCKYMAN